MSIIRDRQQEVRAVLVVSPDIGECQMQLKVLFMNYVSLDTLF